MDDETEHRFPDEDDEAFRAAIAEAEADVAAGRLVDGEVVDAWLKQAADALRAGQPVPPPPIPADWK